MQNGMILQAILDYLQMDIADEKAYAKVEEIAKQKEQEFGEHPVVIFYMAVAPQLVPGNCKKFRRITYLQRY